MKEIENFYRNNKSRLVKVISPKVGGHMDVAEDVVQEAFCNAFRFFHHYDESRGKLSTWFNTILYNTMRDTQRTNMGHPTEELTDLNAPEVLAEVRLSPSAETSLIIQQALGRVTNPRHKRVLELFFIMGFSSKEIALCEEGVSQSNVTTIVKRYKDKLR